MLLLGILILFQSYWVDPTDTLLKESDLDRVVLFMGSADPGEIHPIEELMENYQLRAELSSYPMKDLFKILDIKAFQKLDAPMPEMEVSFIIQLHHKDGKSVFTFMGDAFEIYDEKRIMTRPMDAKLKETLFSDKLIYSHVK